MLNVKLVNTTSRLVILDAYISLPFYIAIEI